MKTYNLDIEQSLSRYGKKLNNKKLLTKNNWVIVDESVDGEDNKDGKSVYFFKENEELIILINGTVEKGRWYHIGNEKLVIEENGKSFLFELCYFNKNYLVLKVDGCNDYAFFVNEMILSYNQKLTDIIKYIKVASNKIQNQPYTVIGAAVGLFITIICNMSGFFLYMISYDGTDDSVRAEGLLWFFFCLLGGVFGFLTLFIYLIIEKTEIQKEQGKLFFYLALFICLITLICLLWILPSEFQKAIN